MIDGPIKKHGDLLCRVGGLLLFVLWLSFLPACIGKGEEANANGAPLQIIKTDVQYAVDFPYTRTILPKSGAWLYQPEMKINQPVMLSDDPAYYLRRQFDGRLNPNGAIFMMERELNSFFDPVITLYGRNCTDLTMFGSLSEYRKDEYYQANPSFFLMTPQGDFQLDVFAGVQTRVEDTTTWRIANSSAWWAGELPQILEKSFIKPNPSLLPVEGDSLAVLATDSLPTQGRARFVIYARKRPIEYAGAKVAYVNQMALDLRDTLNGYMAVENVGEWMHYAQNDPVWKDLIFESKVSRRRRSFGDGGCGPTAVAMAIVNMVEKEELETIRAFAEAPFGYRFCVDSVNENWCSHRHLPYQLTTPEEYLRYFPLVVASIATGNNTWGIRGRGVGFGSSMRYLEKLCGVFGISVTKTNQMRDTIAFLQQGKTIALACTAGGGSPFTSTSHFIVLAGADDEYLYVLDPLRRARYDAWDKNNYLEVVKPGLVRIKHQNATECNIAPIWLLERKAESY